MALNFTVSYTFAPSTTISSTQVNTNTSDVAAVFQGLEAETKTLAKLKVDIDPTLALEVATKQYVDHYSTYRRPNLITSSTTVVSMETGIDGTSGEARILFSDGNLRTDSTSTRYACNLAQTAVLSGSARSGLRTGTVANNTWYAVYAVKVTDSSTNFVSVADTVLPLQANYATLNSNFGTNGWVYLGMIRNGDNASSPSGIVNFFQNGNFMQFRGGVIGNTSGFLGSGVLLATTAGATSLTYTNVFGTGAAQIPTHINIIQIAGAANAGSGSSTVDDAANSSPYMIGYGSGKYVARFFAPASDGFHVSNGSSVTMDIFLCGYIDPVLGVGSNPIL